MEASAKRRTPFAEVLPRRARANALELCDTVEFRWRRRYNLPATDDRFLDSTVEDMLTDLYAHRFVDDPKLREEMTTDNFDAEWDAFEREAGGDEELGPDELPDDFEPVI
jgi:hypothetical protein